MSASADSGEQCDGINDDGASAAALASSLPPIHPKISPPCRTFQALLVLRAQFPQQCGFCVPVLLRHQLYAMGDADKTQTDREIEVMLSRAELRQIRLPLSEGDMAVVFTQDLLAAMRSQFQAYRQLASSPPPPLDAASFEQLATWLDERVFRFHSHFNIAKDDMHSLLEEFLGDAHGDKVDAVVSLLFRLGFLKAVDSTKYGWTLPRLGAFVGWLTKGRNELLTRFRRCRFKEILELEVRQKPLKQSQLGMAFHIQDLVGRGTLHRIPTTSGDLLRLAGEVQNRQMTWA
ncbi:unnamed protein product [Vitrella brassicaformis CCMP3155]|uniref:Uncharacterized protein n=1 Tax=Vitrella brassicaformis (strain CCMP3155) TaxID=1169540 RepID=A0A0G4FUU1_VITBC|nr:unnamed protein product [Vitrella brassicaformis CCMP3155]|mmetsp:Transcript_37772/g.94702  ORF Transcript_37772/g.94702 Transcript_37772/m.94702 type:complete len:290 (-) Transcript_37772:114-983(-)|eukprot:CEM18716.1 unnamed protein product [Vitrella brassicaformis CCMP3155]